MIRNRKFNKKTRKHRHDDVLLIRNEIKKSLINVIIKVRVTARIFNEMHRGKSLSNPYEINLLSKFVETGSIPNKKLERQGFY